MAGSNIRDLRRRIRSVKNTSQLTRAMKMVSAAKLRRAQNSMMAARPYSHSLQRVLAEAAERVRADLHPLLAARDEPKSVDLLIIAGDKGLCGSFNAALFRVADRTIREKRDEGLDVRLVLVGKKAVEYYRRQDLPIVEGHADVFRTFDYGFAASVANGVQERFVGGDTDGVLLVYNEFKSAISQKLIVEPLFPIGGIGEHADDKMEYLYEPSAEELMNRLLPRFVAFRLYHAMLESIAAEHAARMAAMDSATRNAEEMIDRLTLVMNRARQAAITTEIIEVVSGAEALG